MTSVLPDVTGSAGALVVLAIVCYLFYTGKLHSDREFSKLEQEKDEYKSALASERTAVDEQASDHGFLGILVARNYFRDFH